MSRTTAPSLVFLLLFPLAPAWAEQVTSTGQPVYVTKSDCARLVAFHPSPDVAYKAGQDVHGKYVAPADLPGNQIPGLVPDKIEFNLNINPMNYAQRNQAQQSITSSSQAVVANNQTLRAAQTKATTLSSQLSTLQSTATTLSAQLATETKGTAAYTQTEQQITANNAAIATTNSAITSNNAVVSNSTSQQGPLQDALTTAQGQAAQYQGKFDNTSLPVAHISVDLASGRTMINGQPLDSEQDRIVADACRGAGVKER
jgi:hypothetical protein